MTAQVLSPFPVGNLILSNRIFLPGHTTNFGKNNLPTTRNSDYLVARAKGGVGLIFTEAIRVHPTSAGRSISLGAFDDGCIDAYSNLTSAVHEYNVPIFAQIMHAGRQANGDSNHTAAWSASPIPWTTGGHVPHVMSKADIKFMVKAFGMAALRMKKANFDGLELHLGHGHLIQQFMSPASNTRSDEYGGNLTNRLRFAVEVMSHIRELVPDMNLGVRISANEFLAGGLDPNQMIEIVSLLSEKFAINFLHTSHSAYHGSWSLPSQFADMNFGHAPYRDHAGIFKREFPNLPVLAVCRLDTISEAAELIDSGEADLVGLARPHIADPNLVSNFISGNEKSNTSCIACNQECIGRVEKNLPISCVTNPTVGREKFWRDAMEQSQSPKQILVVGGGPAGLRAAVTAAQRGHQVTLMEATNRLGGQINQISSLKKRRRFKLLIDDLMRELKNSTVDVKLNSPVSDISSSLSIFDHIVLATGSNFHARDFGIGAPTIDAITAIEKYASNPGSGDIIVVDEEGTWIAGSITEELAELGYQVHLISPTASLFSQITMYSKLALIPRLRNMGVQIHLAAKVSSDATGVTISGMLNDAAIHIANPLAIIDCGPRQANDFLYQSLDPEFEKRCQVIGDALSPRTAAEAIFEGNAVGAFLDLDFALTKIEANQEAMWTPQH